MKEENRGKQELARKHIKVRMISDREHNSQIITGFFLLRDACNIEFISDIHHREKHRYDIPAIVECEYGRMRIAYDTEDGYFTGIESWVEKYDLYFKRSYSAEKNLQILGSKLSQKVFPLGFNYFVTCKGNPYGFMNKTWKTYVRRLLGRMSDDYFTPDKFEMTGKADDQRVIFYTRLWKPEDYLDSKTNAERICINETRIALLRKLKEICGDKFVGGLSNTPFAREMAADLVAPPKITRRENYLKLLHSSGIAIGTMGLHESIGWKTGEYVAAGKAIINERFHYEVPGDFQEGDNYLPYESVEECLYAVKYLLNRPQEIVRMQQRNRQYYEQYLVPDRLIERTLQIAEKANTRQ